jgi:hypothetical protein
MKVVTIRMILALTFFCFGMAISQMTITEQDLAGLDGSTGTYEITTTGNVPVDMKQAAPNQVWDFTNVNFSNSIVYQYTFQATAGMPEQADFPQANYVMMEYQVGDPDWYVHTFVDLDDDSLIVIGKKMNQGGTVGSHMAGPDDYYAVPLTYGTTWTAVSIDTIDLDGGSIVVETEAVHTVDAYGTIKVPAGEFQCLRLRSEGSEDGGSFHWVRYTFLNEDVLLLATVQGPPDQTNLNFTNATYVQVFSSVDSDVGHKDVQTTSPKALRLAQNYPNPFNPDTRIALDVPSYQRIELAVFNVRGERIRILYSSNLYPGSHSFMWDGMDSYGNPVSSGIYVVQLRGRDTSLSRRMILMR